MRDTEHPPHALDPVDSFAFGRCPTEILETALLLSSSGEDVQSVYLEYYELWRTILRHFFPASERYTIREDWEIPHSSQPARSPSRTVSFAVFPPAHTQPFVLVQVSSQTEFKSEMLRDTAAQETSHIFDLVSPYSAFNEVLVISAMGQSWKGFRRETALTSAEAESWWIGPSRQQEFDRCDWFDNVVSQSSWDFLAGMIDIMKHSLPGELTHVEGKYNLNLT